MCPAQPVLVLREWRSGWPGSSPGAAGRRAGQQTYKT